MAKLGSAVIFLREALTSLAPSPGSRRRLRRREGRAAFAAAALGSGAVAAYAVPSLTTVLSLLGCTVGVLFSLCLPAALYAMLFLGWNRRISSASRHFKLRLEDLQ